MAKTREIACVSYVCEGNCNLGKDATFYGHCQTCKSYRKTPGGHAARTDNRKQKLDRIMRKEKWD